MPSIPSEIDYNLHVKQTLSNKCFTCHGLHVKKQKADLRLDLPSVALSKVTESELKVIYLGKISQNEMVYRILIDDPDYRMPEPFYHLTLTAYEKTVLIKWIEQRAKYKPQWAYIVPKKENISTVKNNPWCKNDIDKFILSKIEETNLAQVPQADKETLIRRLSFDISGFSPSVKEIDAFAKQRPKCL